jgi:hypothetical protein
MSCSICVEDFNNSGNAKVECMFCNKEACKTCIRTYLLNSDNDPHCMFCKENFDYCFITEQLNKTWILGPYKKHRENLLMNREIAKLPETQAEAISTIKIENINEEIKKLSVLKKELSEQIKNINSKINILLDKIGNINKNKSKDSARFNFKCPNKDCNGFLNNKYNCEICKSDICKDCMEIITEENHVCDNEKKESVEFIKKDTKPCPSCGEMIHKIHGCDQMWCPSCKVAFSWRTGELVKGNIHNPEYYRWIRENNEVVPRTQNENHCGLLPDIRFILNNIKNLSSPVFQQTILNAHRLAVHINATVRNYNPNEDLKSLRINYIRNKINKDEFKAKIQILIKKQNKNRDTNNALYLLRDIIVSNMWSLAENINQGHISNQFILNISDNLEKIRIFTNDSLLKISNCYSNNAPFITQNFTESDIYFIKLHKNYR